MIVVVVSAAPLQLRGALTRWFLQIDAGVFVGHLSARVRAQVWELIEKSIGDGRALMAWSASSEQHLEMRTIGYDRQPLDIEGLTVVLEPGGGDGGESYPGVTSARESGWSVAGRRRRFRSNAARALPVSE